jgi:hypothetical protein
MLTIQGRNPFFFWCILNLLSNFNHAIPWPIYDDNGCFCSRMRATYNQQE